MHAIDRPGQANQCGCTELTGGPIVKSVLAFLEIQQADMWIVDTLGTLVGQANQSAFAELTTVVSGHVVTRASSSTVF